MAIDTISFHDKKYQGIMVFFHGGHSTMSTPCTHAQARLARKHRNVHAKVCEIAPHGLHKRDMHVHIHTVCQVLLHKPRAPLPLRELKQVRRAVHVLIWSNVQSACWHVRVRVAAAVTDKNEKIARQQTTPYKWLNNISSSMCMPSRMKSHTILPYTRHNTYIHTHIYSHGHGHGHGHSHTRLILAKSHTFVIGITYYIHACYIYTSTYVHAYRHSCMHTMACVHIHTYTYMHTYTQNILYTLDCCCPYQIKKVD